MSILAPHILIIDDDLYNSELIELLLHYSNAAYKITRVQTPEEGWPITATHDFDLIVLDYFLPGMSGAEICRAIRRLDTDTPVMFFTASAYEHERREAMQAGANAYLVKPDDLKVLTETVKRLLSGHKHVSRPKHSVVGRPGASHGSRPDGRTPGIEV